MQNVYRHMKEAAMLNEFSGLVSNIEWTLARIEIGGWVELESDLSRLEEICSQERKGNDSEGHKNEAEGMGVGILRAALQTSWKRIRNAPHSVGFELFGRISSEDRKYRIVDTYLKSIEDRGLKPWLRPVTTSLQKRDRQVHKWDNP